MARTCRRGCDRAASCSARSGAPSPSAVITTARSLAAGEEVGVRLPRPLRGVGRAESNQAVAHHFWRDVTVAVRGAWYSTRFGSAHRRPPVPRLCWQGMVGSDVTRILDAAARGDPWAAGELLALVYAELRKLTAQRMVQESPGQTLGATALVHEAYLRLVDVDEAQSWDGRGHLFAAAAEAAAERASTSTSSARATATGRGRRRLRRRSLYRATARAGRGPDGAGVGRGRGRGQAPLLRRPDHRRGGRRPGHLRPHRQPPLGVRKARLY